jgi:hypothetical protein
VVSSKSWFNATGGLVGGDDVIREKAEVIDGNSA